MNLISSEPEVLRSCLHKLVMPEREVAVSSTDEGRNSCPELPIFFLLGLIPSFVYKVLVTPEKK